MTESRDNDRRHPNVVNVDELSAQASEEGAKFGARFKMLANAAGAVELGGNYYEVPPGRSAFPYHYHCAIEEALFILDGEGTLRIGDAKVAVRSGDWVSFPVGPDCAHRLDNTSERPLRYLCLSTRTRADVVGYPDSNKVGAMASPTLDFAKPWVCGLYRADETAEYYEGEDVD